MQQKRQVIREFRWNEIFPALMLLRVFRSSVRIHALLLSLVATILITQGWRLIAVVTLPTELREVTASASSSPSNALAGLSFGDGLSIQSLVRPIFQEYERFAAPIRNLFTHQPTWGQRTYLLLGSAWTLLVGAFFAGVICRTAAFDLASQERYGVFRAIRFVARRYRSFFTAPLIPLAVITAMTLPILLLGFVGGYISSFLAALAWGLAILWSIAMGLAALVSLTSWPLIWPALASEDSDAFDALGASFGYSAQRPFSYIAYVLLAALVSGAGFLIFAALLGLGRGLLLFGLTAGGGADVTAAFYGDASLTSRVVSFWEYFFTSLGDAYLFSAFWTSATAVFLLLRYDVDGAELDDIYNDGPGEGKPMPKLAREMGLTGEEAAVSAPVAPPTPPKSEPAESPTAAQ